MWPNTISFTSIFGWASLASLCAACAAKKVTKNKAVFPNDEALLKMLYLAAMDITRKWTGKRKDWAQIHAQLEVFFGDRMPL